MEILRVTVLTSEGTIHKHDYDNTPERQSEMDLLFAELMQIIANPGGAILMANPMVIYNAAHIIRVSQSVVDEGAELDRHVPVPAVAR